MCVYRTIRVRKEKPLTGEEAGGVVWERWNGGMEMTYEGLKGGKGNDVTAF